MLNLKQTFLALLTLVALCLSKGGWAQVQIDIKGVGQNRIPIVVAPFVQAKGTPQDIGTIVRADLVRSGRFRTGNHQQEALGVASDMDLSGLRARGFDYLVNGSVRVGTDSRYEIQFQLWDITHGYTLAYESLRTARADLRYAAHRIADMVYEAIIGVPGTFASRITYVTKDAGTYRLWVADTDGKGAQTALISSEAILSPSWSPQGDKLAYVSLESRKPVVYVQDLVSGKRKALASFKGSNSAPTWSPDGKELLVTLSQDGGSQLFRIPAQGGEPQRFLRSNSIDTEAFWAKDGFIYFVSDRGGSPQIYRIAQTGGSPQRLTFSGDYNVSPVVSLDGQWLAYVSRNADGSFGLYVMDLATKKTRPVARAAVDGSPSFAPNGQLILYAKRAGKKDIIMASTLDGSFKMPLPGKSESVREPNWGPLLY